MSETPGSTLGFERRFNPFLKIDEEQEFVRELTHDLAPQPPNFQWVVELNRGPLLTEAAPLDPIVPARLQELLTNGATLIDGREPREFDAAYISGSLNVTMVRAAVGTRAAWVVDPNSEAVVTAAGDAEAKRMALMLEAVGFRQLRGYVAGGLPAWQASDLPTSATEAIDVATLAERLQAKQVVLLDVREQDEWQDGHVEGSLHTSPSTSCATASPPNCGRRQSRSRSRLPARPGIAARWPPRCCAATVCTRCSTSPRCARGAARRRRRRRRPDRARNRTTRGGNHMKSEVPEVSAEEAFARSASGEAVIVDVRESDEWEAGHIPGALHIPLAELEARWPELRSSDSVIAVCRSGNRSATATQALRSVGIDAANLSGGMKAWAGAELPFHAPNARVA